MISLDGEFILCNFDGCDQKIKNNKWGKIKAEGWFFMKVNKAFCPNHIPDWVDHYRKET